jgi:hypothetical protein
MARHGASVKTIGRVSSTPRLEVSHLTESRSTKFDCDVDVETMTKAWRGTLDW